MPNANRADVTLLVEAGADARERDALTGKLRRELQQLKLDRLERPSAGDAPPGTRAGDIAQIGTLLVTVASTATALGSLVAAVRSWLAAHGNGTVRMQIGNDTLEITGALSEEQKQVVTAWIKKHETP